MYWTRPPGRRKSFCHGMTRGPPRAGESGSLDAGNKSQDRMDRSPRPAQVGGEVSALLCITQHAGFLKRYICTWGKSNLELGLKKEGRPPRSAIRSDGNYGRNNSACASSRITACPAHRSRSFGELERLNQAATNLKTGTRKGALNNPCRPWLPHSPPPHVPSRPIDEISG